QAFWVHHQSQGFVYGSRPPNDTLPNTRAAGSAHPQGLNAAFADGHVQFIKNSIDYTTYRALYTRARGEVVGHYYLTRWRAGTEGDRSPRDAGGPVPARCPSPVQDQPPCRFAIYCPWGPPPCSRSPRPGVPTAPRSRKSAAP